MMRNMTACFLQNDVIWMNQDKVEISKSWILIDSQSTVGFSNPRLLMNKRDSKHVIILYCNADKVSVTLKVI